eukprot:SAG11_NODE_5139_length_1654_cov_1.357556_2_plen_248_part_00
MPSARSTSRHLRQGWWRSRWCAADGWRRRVVCDATGRSASSSCVAVCCSTRKNRCSMRLFSVCNASNYPTIYSAAAVTRVAHLSTLTTAIVCRMLSRPTAQLTCRPVSAPEYPRCTITAESFFYCAWQRLVWAESTHGTLTCAYAFALQFVSDTGGKAAKAHEIELVGVERTYRCGRATLVGSTYISRALLTVGSLSGDQARMGYSFVPAGSCVRMTRRETSGSHRCAQKHTQARFVVARIFLPGLL